MKSDKVDYDQIAPSYDERYANRRYFGIERTLRDSCASVPSPRRCGVLEVGCGTGYWLQFLRSCGCQVAGLDVSAEMLRFAAGKVSNTPLLRGTAAHLPFRNRSFDRVIMVNVLHHLSSPATCIGEAYRVLRPAGTFVSLGLDPSTGLDDWYVYDYFDGVRETDLIRYPDRISRFGWLQAAGFENVQTSVAEHFTESVDARAYRDRGSAAKHSTSQLALLGDQEYEAGIARIREDIQAAEERGAPLSLRADLRIYATTGVVPT